MCGIVGVIAKKNNERFFADELFRMCRMQKHRGPDDEGGVCFSLSDQRVFDLHEGDFAVGKGLFGFERLSIQDLSDKGHQPMQDVSSKVSLIFNGEIYNFIELRSALEKAGHIFISGTDTEVILHMYLEYGIEETLKKINGMFSLAIADMRSKRVYIARDRFGIKPLYMAHTEDAILFASEMKSFLPFHSFSAEINMDALEEYLLFKSLMSATLFKNVEQIKPGALWICNLETNELVRDRFFDIESYSRIDDNCSYDDLKDKFWDSFHSVIKRQTISDVKVGCQLSGGVDSSILSMVVAKEHNLYDTVSCKVNCGQQADAPYIDIVNTKLNANAHIGIMDSKYFIDKIIDVVWNFESILSHTPSVGMYQISECANENNIKVLLSGEGADELFGGYKCFANLSFSEGELSEEKIIKEIVFRDGKESDDFLKRILPSIKTERFYQERIEHLNHFTGSAFDRQVKYELSTQLNELLDRQDKMAMSHSVENRVPFLDNQMADFAWSVPERYLMNRKNGEGKYILKSIVSEQFSHDFAFRKKVGFFIPGNLFLCSNMDFVHRVLGNIRKRGVICCDILDGWAEKELHILGGLNYYNSAVFFKMFTFEIWCQLFIDGLSVEECKIRNGIGV